MKAYEVFGVVNNVRIEEGIYVDLRAPLCISMCDKVIPVKLNIDKESRIYDVDIECDKESGRFSIVPPRSGIRFNRVLIRWHINYYHDLFIATGADIRGGNGVTVIANESSSMWHQFDFLDDDDDDYPFDGEYRKWAKILAVLKPGQELFVPRFGCWLGRRLWQPRARLTWDGEKIAVEKL